MRASWLIAIAAGAAIGASAPTELLAQGNSNRARQQQQRQEERERAREQSRRQEERTQLQREREQRRRQQATQVRVPRNDDRYERNRRNDRDWRYNDRRYDDRRWDDRRYDDRYDRRGPAFCRSGEGHPVFGREWCRDKGFGLGRERSRDIWGDIIFRQPRDRRYDDRRLGSGTLGDILGSVVLGRFDDYGRSYYGGQGTLNGRWLDGRSVMQLYMGSIPIARLIDFDRDGRVDDVILAR